MLDKLSFTNLFQILFTTRIFCVLHFFGLAHPVKKNGKVRQLILEKNYRKKFRELEVTYVHGESGAGKTRDIMERYDYEVCSIGSYERPFDGYAGQDVIVSGEFRSSFRACSHYGIGTLLAGFPPLFVSFSLLAAGKPRQSFLDWRKTGSKSIPIP